MPISLFLIIAGDQYHKVDFILKNTDTDKIELTFRELARSIQHETRVLISRCT